MCLVGPRHSASLSLRQSEALSRSALICLVQSARRLQSVLLLMVAIPALQALGFAPRLLAAVDLVPNKPLELRRSKSSRQGTESKDVRAK